MTQKLGTRGTWRTQSATRKLHRYHDDSPTLSSTYR
ncbi:hypothetical protein JTE90_005347, partial [Oedothorax gibbosus]